MNISIDIPEEDYKLIEEGAKKEGADLNSYVLNIFEDVYSRMTEATKDGGEFELSLDVLEHRIVLALAKGYATSPEAMSEDLGEDKQEG